MSKDGKASAKTCEMLPRVLTFPTMKLVQDAFDETKWYAIFDTGYPSWTTKFQLDMENGNLSK